MDNVLVIVCVCVVGQRGGQDKARYCLVCVQSGEEMPSPVGPHFTATRAVTNDCAQQRRSVTSRGPQLSFFASGAPSLACMCDTSF